MNYWSDADIEMLRKMIGERHSFSEVGKTIGRTRSAVASRCRRLGLKGSSGKTTKGIPAWNKGLKAGERKEPWTPKKTATKVEEVLVAPPKPQPVIVVPYDEKRPVVALVDLQEAHCRWPKGDVGSAAFGFCGATRRRTDEGTITWRLPYCSHHHGIAYQKAQR